MNKSCRVRACSQPTAGTEIYDVVWSPLYATHMQMSLGCSLSMLGQRLPALRERPLSDTRWMATYHAICANPCCENDCIEAWTCTGVCVRSSSAAEIFAAGPATALSEEPQRRSSSDCRSSEHCWRLVHPPAPPLQQQQLSNA